MSIKVECSECFATYDVEDELVNQKIRCKDCAATIQVIPTEENPENEYYSLHSTESETPQSAGGEDDSSSLPELSYRPRRTIKKKKKKTKQQAPPEDTDSLGVAFDWTNPSIRYCLLALVAKCVVIGLAVYITSILLPTGKAADIQRRIDLQFLGFVAQMFILQIVILQAVLTIIWRIRPLRQLTGGILFLGLLQELWALWLLSQMGAESFVLVLSAVHGVLAGVAGYLLCSADAEEHFWTSYNDPLRIGERPDGMRAAILFQALLVLLSIPELGLSTGLLRRFRQDDLIILGAFTFVLLFRLIMLFGYWRAFRWARLVGLWGIPLVFIPLSFGKLMIFFKDTKDFYWLIPLTIGAAYVQFLIFLGLYQQESKEHCVR